MQQWYQGRTNRPVWMLSASRQAAGNRLSSLFPWTATDRILPWPPLRPAHRDSLERLSYPSGALEQAFQPVPIDRSMNNEFRTYRRKLPHWESAGSVYFITFNTAGDLALDDECKDIVINAIKFHEDKKYELYACVAMSSHVHVVLQPLEQQDGGFPRIAEITQGIKGYSAWKINGHLGRKGQVWQTESYDRIVRNQHEFDEKVNYIINNALKAGLVVDPERYRWLYLKGQ
ncbi:MAG: transposase [Chloroflexi bacterium]|nr:transposase [Chloroflexota bacterium]